MKRILILTAGFGEGHNSAARGLCKALERQPETHAEIHDLFEESYGSISDFVRKAYLGTINHAPKVWQQFYELVDRTDMVSGNLGVLSRMRDHLERLVDFFRPDAIALTYPLYGYLLDRIHRGGKPRPCGVFTVVTDSISVNSVWTKFETDWMLVPNIETERVVTGMGVEPSTVRTLGFPVDPAFADLRDVGMGGRCGGEPWRFLYMVNSGKKHAPALLQSLVSRGDVALTVTAGRDEDLRETLERTACGANPPVQVLGWTDRMPELLCRSDCLIGKAGGATVQEAFAAACPMIITQVVPGQEEGNAQLVTSNRCGVVSRDAESGIPEIVDEVLSDGARRLGEWRGNMLAQSRPDASLRVADFILGCLN